MPRKTLKARAMRDAALDDKTGAAQPEGSFITVHGHPVFIPADIGRGLPPTVDAVDELASDAGKAAPKGHFITVDGHAVFISDHAGGTPAHQVSHAEYHQSTLKANEGAKNTAAMQIATKAAHREHVDAALSRGESVPAFNVRAHAGLAEKHGITLSEKQNGHVKAETRGDKIEPSEHSGSVQDVSHLAEGDKVYDRQKRVRGTVSSVDGAKVIVRRDDNAIDYIVVKPGQSRLEHLHTTKPREVGGLQVHDEADGRYIDADFTARAEAASSSGRRSYDKDLHFTEVRLKPKGDRAIVEGLVKSGNSGATGWFPLGSIHKSGTSEGISTGTLSPEHAAIIHSQAKDLLSKSSPTSDAEVSEDLEDTPRCRACGAFTNERGDCSVCGSGVLTPDPMFVQPLTYGHGTPGTDGLPLTDSLLADTPDDSGVVLLSDAKKDGLGRYRQLGTIADIVNLNKRRYPRKVLDRALEPARERAHAGAMLGNLVHPRVVSDGYEEHYVDEPHRRATRITDIGQVQKDGRVFIDFQILDTPCGRILKDSFVRGKPYGPSTRFVVPEKAFHREGDVLVTDEMDIHTWDHVINPAVAETSREYTALSDSLRADLGLAGGSPAADTEQGRPASGVLPPRRYKMEPIGILNRCWALFNGRAPAAEIKAVRQMAVDAIAKAGEAGEDVSDVSAKLAAFDATIETVPGYSGGRVTLVHGNDTGTNGAGSGYAPEITDTKDNPVTGRPPIEDKDRVDGLTSRGTDASNDEVTAATLAWAKEQMERQKAAADAEALKVAVSDAIEAAKDLPELAKLNADAQEMVLSQVRSGAQNAEQVPTLIADSVALYMKAAAAERLAGGGLIPATGNTVSDPARAGGHHPAEVTREAMPWMVETEKLLTASDDFGASQINNPAAVVQRSDREMVSIRKFNREGANGEPGFINDILLPQFAARYKSVAASDASPREAVRQWFERDDAIMLAQRGQGSGRNFTDEFVKPALAMMDAVTTANLLNQPTIMTAIIVQMFWNLRALQFVQGVGPGMGMGGNRGWYNHDGGIGTVLKIPTESMGWGTGLAQKPQRNFVPAGAFAEDAGISPINYNLRWLSFVPAMFKAAIELTKEAELSLGQGPLNYPAWGRALYWLGVSKSLNLDPLMFNEMYNVSDEYGAVAVAGETATLADNSVYNGSGSITVNLNPKKLASAAVAAGDPFVTYGANVVGAIRLNCAGSGNASPYCGNPGSSLTSGVLAAGTLQPPIVRPRSVTTFDGSGNPSSTVTNPVTLTAPASQVQGFLDDTNQVAAGVTASPVWAVDYVHGTLVFTSGLSTIAGSGGVMTAPATVTVSYSYATNFDAYQVNNLNLPAGVTVEDYMNGLVNQLNFTAAYMAGPGRYSPPDLALMGVGAAPNIERASIFWNRASPTGTELFPTESYFARRNGIDMARFNSPVQVGDNRILLTRRGTTFYAVDEPFNTDGPWPKYDTTSGFIKDTRVFMGRERYCIATPMAQDANGNITNPPSRSIVLY